MIGCASRELKTYYLAVLEYCKVCLWSRNPSRISWLSTSHPSELQQSHVSGGMQLISAAEAIRSMPNLIPPGTRYSYAIKGGAHPKLAYGFVIYEYRTTDLYISRPNIWDITRFLCLHHVIKYYKSTHLI